MPEPQILLTQDTREQLGYQELFETPCVIDTLNVGDYSVAGLQNLVAIERKSLGDLLGSLTRGRERFEKELAKARSFQRFYVVVEASAPDVLAGNYGRYGSQCNPKSIWESVCAFSVRYAPFIFAGDRKTGARLTESLLCKFAREHIVAVENMQRASRKLKAG